MIAEHTAGLPSGPAVRRLHMEITGDLMHFLNDGSTTEPVAEAWA